MTMAYILVVNLSYFQMQVWIKVQCLQRLHISSIIATLLMGIVANYPIALAPGMGLKCIFANTVVLQMGYSHGNLLLCAVFIEGIIFILLTVTNVREKIIECIPMNLKFAVTAGIGIFIAYVGLQNANIVVSGTIRKYDKIH